MLFWNSREKNIIRIARVFFVKLEQGKQKEYLAILSSSLSAGLKRQWVIKMKTHRDCHSQKPTMIKALVVVAIVVVVSAQTINKVPSFMVGKESREC